MQISFPTGAGARTPTKRQTNPPKGDARRVNARTLDRRYGNNGRLNVTCSLHPAPPPLPGHRGTAPTKVSGRASPLNVIHHAAYLGLRQQIGGYDALEAIPDHLRRYFLSRRNLSSPEACVPLACHCRYHNSSGRAVVHWLPCFTRILSLGLLAAFSKVRSAN